MTICAGVWFINFYHIGSILLARIQPGSTATPLPTLTRVIPSPTPVGCAGRNGAQNAGQSRLKAIHRSGQTFLTWPEQVGLNGERYRIYRSNCPIDANNIVQATLLAEVGKDSARWYANRYIEDSSQQWKPRYADRLIINNNGSPILPGTGLLVWTLGPEDFASASQGEGYYAVVVIPPGGKESFDPRDTLGPVSEAIGIPRPVEITSSPGVKPGEGGHAFIQYMDLRHWNGTFHAPNPTNLYYGLNPADPNLAAALAYAYDYTIYLPNLATCRGKIPDVLPAAIELHGYRANSYWAPFKNDQNYCAYMIYPIDETETWYFGFARKHDYRLPGEFEAGDVIENYTEQRILQMLYALELHPFGPPVDQGRVYVFGQSMGGSGALAFAERYPNIFAAAYANQPVTTYRVAGYSILDRVADVAGKWGPPELNLPVALSAPAHWADPIQKYNGTGVWDWQDYRNSLSGSLMPGRLADEMAPVGILHGNQDHVVEFAIQGQPMYDAFNAGLRAWAGVINTSDHRWQYFTGVPVPLSVLPTRFPFWDLQVVRDESVPGMSNSSGDPPVTDQGERSYNQTLKWSSSWDPWDGAPVDQPEQWQISLCAVALGSLDCGTGKVLTVDVTPRRLQHFKVIPEAQYTWQNIRVSDGKILEEGRVTADGYGLITVKSFKVSPAGNRLLITPYTGR